jgi:hypothetical protein
MYDVIETTHFSGSPFCPGQRHLQRSLELKRGAGIRGEAAARSIDVGCLQLNLAAAALTV